MDDNEKQERSKAFRRQVDEITFQMEEAKEENRRLEKLGLPVKPRLDLQEKWDRLVEVMRREKADSERQDW
jgi:hypothetical protein